MARPFIESRMLEYESEQLSFNLLALCQSPLNSLQDSLAANAASLAQFDEPMAEQHPSPSAATSPNKPPPTSHENGDCIVAASAPSPEGGDSAQQLRVEQARLRAEYESELALVQEDEQRVAARREDYTLAIHTWVDMLASKGALKELHQGTREEP